MTREEQIENVSKKQYTLFLTGAHKDLVYKQLNFHLDLLIKTRWLRRRNAMRNVVACDINEFVKRKIEHELLQQEITKLRKAIPPAIIPPEMHVFVQTDVEKQLEKKKTIDALEQTIDSLCKQVNVAHTEWVIAFYNSVGDQELDVLHKREQELEAIRDTVLAVLAKVGQ